MNVNFTQCRVTVDLKLNIKAIKSWAFGLAVGERQLTSVNKRC